jgi:hypothetical protein
LISESDKGWMAGVVDFQGHVIRRANGHRAQGSEHVSIYVDTRITEISSKLCAMTGTSPEPKANGHAALKVEWLRRGCVEHCPEPHQHIGDSDISMPPTVKWSATGCAVAIILWNLLPHMQTRREPWEWAMGMGFASTRLTGRGSQAALSAIRRLHSLGWELPPLFREAVPRELEAAGAPLRGGATGEASAS